MPDITEYLAAHQARVDGLFIAGSHDGPDPDNDVDLTPLQGLTITLTPSVRVVELPHLTPPATLVLRTWTLTTDALGRLTNPETGEIGVAIPSSDVASDDPDRPVVWTSTISAPDTGVPAITKHWVAPAGETIDLTVVESIPGVTPINLTQWQRLVADARGAKDLAVAASSIAVDARDKAAASEAAAAGSATAAAASASSASDSRAAAATSASSAATSASAATAARDATLAASTIVGAGRPDVSASMTADVRTLVSAATSGAVFRSTDGPQGAWVWRKRGSTWVCIEGDTGWRDVASYLVAGLAKSTNIGTAKVRRVNDIVEYRFKVDVSTSGLTRIWDAPAGFQDTSGDYPTVPTAATGTATGLGLSQLSTAPRPMVITPTSTSLTTGSTTPWPTPGTVLACGTYSTPQQWPTTLPGSPA